MVRVYSDPQGVIGIRPIDASFLDPDEVWGSTWHDGDLYEEILKSDANQVLVDQGEDSVSPVCDQDRGLPGA